MRALVMMTLVTSLWIICASIAGEIISHPGYEFRVMTYNIRYKSMDDRVEKDGKTHPWDGRKRMVLAAIREVGPDLAGFQECQPDQREYLSQNLNEYGSSAAIFWKKDKFELIGKGGLKQWKAPKEPTGVAPKQLDWVRLKWKTTDAEIFCFNIHCHPALKEPIRVQVCRNMGDFINQVAGAGSLAILLGDLNIHDTDSKGIQIIRETANMSDPWTDTGTSQRYTWNNWFRPKWSNTTIDWILYRRPLKAQFVKRCEYNEDGEYPSDHTPVYTSLGVVK